MIKIDYRIMGVPSRMENIKKIKYELGISDDKVFIDTEYHHNPMWTWKQTVLLPSDNDVTHLCIIQDDAILCDGFKKFCEYLANRFENAILSLFNRLDMSNKFPRHCITQPGCCLGGLGFIIPIKYINDIIKEQEEEYPDYIHDDNWLIYWAYNHKIDFFAPFPSIIQSFDDDSSILKHDYGQAYTFCKEPLKHHWINATEKRWSYFHDFKEPVI